MSDPADQSSAQAPIVVSKSQVQFIVAALRAGKRAILVSGQDPSSARVADDALAACVSASVGVLHIGHPLPSLLELQDMIGNAVGITGGLGIAPQAMARMLLTSVPPWQSLVLAIDDADTLSRQSLYYLAQLSNALAAAAPVLQIVFAAGPALLEHLNHPDFETFRNCIVASQEDFEQEDDRPKSQPAQARVPQVIAPRTIQLPALSTAPRRPLFMSGRVVLHLTWTGVVAAVLTIGSLLAIGYGAFLAYSDSQTGRSALAVNTNTPQELAGAPNRSPPTPPDAPEPDKAIALLIDQLETAMAHKSPGATPDGEALADRIETLASQASPTGRLMVVALKDRIAAKVIADIEAGRSEEARQLAQYLGRSGNSRNDAVPIAAADSEGASSNGAPSQREETALAQALRPNDAGQAEAAQKVDQPIVFPGLVGPAAPPEAVPGPPVTGTHRAQVAVVEDKAATEISADLPAFAPIRVALTFPRNDRAAAERASTLQQALMAAKVEVAGLDAVDASRPAPGIGYYFRSDRDAAIAVSRRVEPLLGHVEPNVLELRGKDPLPGTIEIALP